jgi:hypothetical protein
MHELVSLRIANIGCECAGLGRAVTFPWPVEAPKGRFVNLPNNLRTTACIEDDVHLD